MCSTIGCAITALDCGMRKVHASPPGGNWAGEKASCTVFDSIATEAMAMATGVMAEPMKMSTLSSVTNFFAFCTPLVGSVASSSTITLSFSPAMAVGHSEM